MAVALLRRIFSSSTAAPSPNSEKPQRLKALINRMFKIRDPDALVSAFNSASSAHARFRASHNIYSSAIRRLSAVDRPDCVRAILEHQKQFPTSAVRVLPSASSPSTVPPNSPTTPSLPSASSPPLTAPALSSPSTRSSRHAWSPRPSTSYPTFSSKSPLKTPPLLPVSCPTTF
ncbi:hypothetical protein IHE45_15G120800 [Dioscorea alata]|uniref:Uncharacterized protein n=1 Tax=Dioscorea alata TaxID=55571 RepID=A0ACB7UP51_DIOAL|nr:hypothetical protein IHE45_15G120800 [Dioscorea alata]